MKAMERLAIVRQVVVLDEGDNPEFIKEWMWQSPEFSAQEVVGVLREPLDMNNEELDKFFNNSKKRWF